jgi:hypothetical protein
MLTEKWTDDELIGVVRDATCLCTVDEYRAIADYAYARGIPRPEVR